MSVIRMLMDFFFPIYLSIQVLSHASFFFSMSKLHCSMTCYMKKCLFFFILYLPPFSSTL